MSVSEPFIRRPIATSLLGIALMIGGALGYWALPVSALPQVDFPTVQVSTQLPGASPDVVASLITAPLERQLGQIPSLSSMNSTSSFGVSQISLQFDLNRDIDGATQDVQAAINAAAGILPKSLPYPPVYAKVNPADAPVMTLALTSDTISLRAMSDLADTILGQRLSQISGVGRVSILGGLKPAVRVQADLARLAAYGIAMEDLRNAIAGANVSGPKGSLDGAQQSYTIAANDQIAAADAYRPIIIAYRNGSPVTIGDVAQIVDGLENDRTGGWYQGTPAVIIDIQRQPGANVIDVVKQIRDEIPRLQRAVPAGVKLTVVSDRTVTIRASVRDVQFTLVLSVVLVTLVVLLFLRSLRATLIAGVALPLSLITSFGIMYFAGFSLDNLSLMALTIGTGFVVDDAIVMIENIVRHMEDGETVMEASLKGASEIGFTVISLTVSLIAVLIPLLFMGDVVGRLFREFAITLSVTILISAVVSLTLVPMACAKLLKPEAMSRENTFQRLSREGFDHVIAIYARMLNWVLDRQTFVLLIALATFGLTALLYVVIPKGFFPVQDTGVIQAISEAPQSVSYAAMAERQQRLASAILRDPDVESLSSFIGVDGTNTTLNSGRILINLKPHEQRKAGVATVMDRIKASTADLTGITLYMQPVQDLTIEGTVSRTQYQFILQDADPNELAEWTPKLVDKLRELPELSDVTSDISAQGLSVFVDIDRDQAARFGITPATIDNALYDSYGQRIVSTVFTNSNQYRVILEADPSLRNSLDSLSSIYLPSSVGSTPVPLSVMAKMRVETAPLQVSHLGQFPSATVSFNLAPGASLGGAVTAIKQAQADINQPLGMVTSFQGAALAFQSSLSNQLFLILAAIITVYIVLGVLYESFIHPLTILSTLPSAGIGALLALMMAGQDLTIIAIIGIILLIGIVKKNAIMMIDFALDAERNAGKPPREAIYQACLLRFRPIIMTTMAAVLGALPLMIGSGAGSELRHPLGISIVGGLLVSQLLTLFTTPVIYLWFDRLALRFAGRADEVGEASGSR
ncbi:MAG TPA: multidrug transporter subunit MdtC [Bradyrhizobium sp.]|nr:multidrug transporter subunit MdtC [Bradyrhizobium sp.]